LTVTGITFQMSSQYSSMARGVGVLDDIGHRRIVTGVGVRKVNNRRMI